MRRLILILGDQLDANSPALTHADPHQDRVWMAEVTEESTHVWSHPQRIALFLAAMRHFRHHLTEQGWTVDYSELDAPENTGSLSFELTRTLEKHRPQHVVLVEPGDHRVRQSLLETCHHLGVPIEFLPDSHFLCSIEDFRRHASERKSLRMEFFYREMRQRHHVLMEDDRPAGGNWNYDSENRKSFGKEGPQNLPSPIHFEPDERTQEVLELVKRRFPNHPGSLDSFAWPVTRRAALARLRNFIEKALPHFGDHQDAMWTGEPYLYHSLISTALNLKLLHPREVIDAAEQAWREGKAPLAATEGFIRQILGWREYVRGIYWLHMPEYLEQNALGADQPLPDFYWTGHTSMHCLSQVIRQTLDTGYAHHIQRLMITGLYALLLGVRPKAVHEWYLAIFVDAVEWVELPNTLGMSQFADGGIMASKPYCASGKYIQRMSNYCRHCPYDPAQKTGPRACPFTTLYWDFLLRHESSFDANPRMKMQLRNLSRLSPDEKAAIHHQAELLRQHPAAQKPQHLSDPDLFS
ncbi:deoxyribodipyrimidine photolyase-related protein [Haloferula luteola]|uniref:Deoxyribodipyrimidine photolyase-related protein n=1 Tax=Haloferula luteola TaxID=595692 RepID=A0A840VBG0_9BACT|nr:cryptochrome/photolyase family protein [Haloferula luteola]MBB5351270.1 deoxyribodipyrimidine photolyase-related protein [Haloferula luteola]